MFVESYCETKSSERWHGLTLHSIISVENVYGKDKTRAKLRPVASNKDNLKNITVKTANKSTLLKNLRYKHLKTISVPTYNVYIFLRVKSPAESREYSTGPFQSPAASFDEDPQQYFVSQSRATCYDMILHETSTSSEI